jgi:hypothetical protein
MPPTKPVKAQGTISGTVKDRPTLRDQTVRPERVPKSGTGKFAAALNSAAMMLWRDLQGEKPRRVYTVQWEDEDR